MDQQHLQSFEGRKVRTVWDDVSQEWYFSVADVVAVLTDSADVKQYIKKMRARDPELGSRWGTICTPTRMMASDGKYYNTQAQKRVQRSLRLLVMILKDALVGVSFHLSVR